MTLYLVKLDPQKPDSRGEPGFVAILGRIIEKKRSVSEVGYRFLPSTSARKPSRKLWPTAISCIPSWATDCGFARLYDKDELDRAVAVQIVDKAAS